MTLVVVRVAGLVTIQDLGRRGHMHEAVPPGGALVPELLVAANRHASNVDRAAAIEVMGQLVVRAEAPIDVATTSVEPTATFPLARTDPRHRLAAGDELVITSEPRRVAYLAIRGGVDAPTILGGRGTMLSAGLGASLRAGDRITGANLHPVATMIAPSVDARPIRVITGPDRFPAAVLAALTSAPYRILPTSDRVGTRLDGPPLLGAPRVDASQPMVRGAIEVPGDGQPIVLGPEHPTTGGYPIIAVIAHADLGSFFATRLGGQVRFVIG